MLLFFLLPAVPFSALNWEVRGAPQHGLHQELRDLFELLIARLAEQHGEVLEFLLE